MSRAALFSAVSVSDCRAHRGLSTVGVIVLLAVVVAGFLSYRAVYATASPAFEVCQRYSDARLFFRYDAALAVSTGDAAKKVRADKANRNQAEMTRSIAGFVWGTWRTVLSETETGDRSEIVFIQGVDRMPERGGATRLVTTRIRARLVREEASWKVSEWQEDEWKEGIPFVHRVRQLTAYRKGEPPGME